VTLIVGLLCQGGVVLASDSEATLGSGSTLTAAQRTSKKLEILDGRVVCATSGSVGLGQRLTEVVRQQTKHNAGGSREDLVSLLRKKMWEVAKPEVEAAQVVARATGNRNDLACAMCTSLVALPRGDTPELVQFSESCCGEYATEALPFVSIGSGQQSADPFLAFLRRTLWPSKGLLPLPDGMLAAYITVKHVIDVLPLGGVGGPVQLVSLAKRDGKWTAVDHSGAELDQHEAAYKDLERVIREWGTSFGKAVAPLAAAAPPA
jgi:hypothetical protein